MNRDRRKKKRIRSAICAFFCSMELLLVLVAFQGIGHILDGIAAGADEGVVEGNIIIPQNTEEEPEEKDGLLVCIDPGHGGKDDGTDFRGRVEKDDTLKLAKALAVYLKEKEINVILTRDDDTYLTLKERTDFANEKNADYLVSLHRNKGDGTGVETWIHSKAGEETKQLADSIMTGLESAGIQRNRGVKKGTKDGENSNYHINVYAQMPACIVELGFVNNAADNQMFDEKIDAYAAAIGDAIIKTYENNGGKDEPKPEQDSSEEEDAQKSFTNTPIANVESLDNTSLDWGQGTNTDDKNRPVGSISYQEKYGKYQALFIGEESKKIYLTIDEGYEYGYTESMLDTLKEKGVKAVFFVTEPYARQEPDLVKRMIAEGHAVGNHSVTHPASGLPSQSIEKQEQEVMGNHQYILDNFGYTMHLFRYPAGKFSEQSLAVVNNCNYKSVFWSFAYLDYDVNNQPEKAASLQKLIDRLHPGGIYLLHGESKTNAELMGEFIDQVRAKGYEFALLE